MKETIVSIIIPVYNGELTIERAINSALKQTYKNIEIIVVNDGSTDETGMVVKQFGEKIKSITTCNFGVSNARNIGIDASNGSYMMFLDADDEIVPDAVEVLLECCLRKKLDMVCGRQIKISDNSKFRMNNKNSSKLVVFENENAIMRAIYDKHETHSSCGILYRKDKVVNCKFPVGKKVHEDAYFVFLCLLNGVRFGVLDTIIYFVHTSRESASRQKFGEKHYDILVLADKKYRLLCAKYPSLKDIGINILIKAHLAFLKCALSDNGVSDYAIESVRFVKYNARYFKPNGRNDIKWFWIVKNGLYSFVKKIRNVFDII